MPAPLTPHRPRLRLLAAGVLVSVPLGLVGCASSELSTTGANGPPRTGTAPAGTILVGDGAGDRAAAALGSGIAITEPSTTTTVVDTTLATTVTTLGGGPKPTVTLPGPTTTAGLPPPSITTPTTRPGSTKPLPDLTGVSLTADEQFLVNKINEYRTGHGLPALSPERYATSTAKTHTQQMASAGQVSAFDNVLNAIPAQYLSAAQGELTGPTMDFVANNVTTNATYIGLISSQFAYIGVGVTTTGNGLRWVTIILGS